MAGESPFSDDWRDCLRAHYQYTVQTSDRPTEATLRVILRDAGFSDSDLAALTIAATAHVDDAPPSFIPDFAGLRAAITPLVQDDLSDDPPPPIDTSLAESDPVALALDDAQSPDVQPEPSDPDSDADEDDAPVDKSDDPDLPVQMSLF